MPWACRRELSRRELCRREPCRRELVEEITVHFRRRHSLLNLPLTEITVSQDTRSANNWGARLRSVALTVLRVWLKFFARARKGVVRTRRKEIAIIKGFEFIDSGLHRRSPLNYHIVVDVCRCSLIHFLSRTRVVTKIAKKIVKPPPSQCSRSMLKSHDAS